MTAYILVVTGVLGAAFGSFINCMAWRIVHGESVWRGRSHCAVCGHMLSAGDLVPVASYFILKGRCRYCGEKISPRYTYTELLMAIAAMGIVWKYDLSVQSLRYLVLSCILLGLSLVDLEIYEIPNGFILAGILWWIVTLPLMGADLLLQFRDGMIGGGAVGGGMLILSLIMDRALKKESLGGGDIKLLFMVGLFLGSWVSLWNLIVSCVLGIVLAVGMKQSKIPFGPAIAGAAWVSIMTGTEVVSWYTGLF